MLSTKILFLIFSSYLSSVDADHFRGGIISWRPLVTSTNSSTVDIQVHQRYFWDRLWGSFSTRCTEANVVAKTSIPVSSYVLCYMNCSSSSFPSVGISTVMTTTDCDPSSLVRSWAGERYTTLTLPLTTSITFGYYSNAWFVTNLYKASGQYWTLASRMNLAKRPDGYINTSPVTNSLPVLFKPVGQQLSHVVQMADNDGTDILKCRWANANSGTNYNRMDECRGACMGLGPYGTLYEHNCTIIFQIPNNFTGWYFVIALQIEDYYDTAAVLPMSSVPIQFLFYAYTPTGSCTLRPEIIGERPNRACIGTPVNVTITEKVVAQVNCPGANITNFVTSSPIGMQHSSIISQGNGLYLMTLTWTPDDTQVGPQGFCAGAVDSKNLQSDAWCITFLVGFESPDLIRITAVQGSASPVGTIFSNHSIFSIQANRNVNRPTRNGTYIRFVDASNDTVVQKFDAGWEPNVVYTGKTIVIVTNYTWKYGANYYVLFDSGVASGVEFCGPESAPITDSSFWRFNIWDSVLSSTTPTPTTPPTTPTITTRGISTTTPNTALTTTGIAITTTIPLTTLTSPRTTSTTTSDTTTTATTATPQVTDMKVFTAKDLEESCKQSIATMTAASMVMSLVIHSVGMFSMFTKLTKMFNPSQVAVKMRHQQRIRNLQRK